MVKLVLLLCLLVLSAAQRYPSDIYRVPDWRRSFDVKQKPYGQRITNRIDTTTPIPEVTTSRPENRTRASLKNINDPNSPYALIHKYFVTFDAANISTTPVPTLPPEENPEGEFNENDLGGLNKNEVFRVDGSLLIIKGGEFPNSYKNQEPDKPIDNYQAPYREPKLPPPGFDFGFGPGYGPEGIPFPEPPFGYFPGDPYSLLNRPENSSDFQGPHSLYGPGPPSLYGPGPIYSGPEDGFYPPDPYYLDPFHPPENDTIANNQIPKNNSELYPPFYPPPPKYIDFPPVQKYIDIPPEGKYIDFTPAPKYLDATSKTKYEVETPEPQYPLFQHPQSPKNKPERKTESSSFYPPYYPSQKNKTEPLYYSFDPTLNDAPKSTTEKEQRIFYATTFRPRHKVTQQRQNAQTEPQISHIQKAKIIRNQNEEPRKQVSSHRYRSYNQDPILANLGFAEFGKRILRKDKPVKRKIMHQKPISLHDDTLVNYRSPLPPINPLSEPVPGYKQHKPRRINRRRFQRTRPRLRTSPERPRQRTSPERSRLRTLPERITHRSNAKRLERATEVGKRSTVVKVYYRMPSLDRPRSYEYSW